MSECLFRGELSVRPLLDESCRPPAAASDPKQAYAPFESCHSKSNSTKKTDHRLVVKPRWDLGPYPHV